MIERDLSEHRALTVINMSASSWRYEPAPDRNVALRAKILALAYRHRRYGAGMIYLKLRQGSECVNHTAAVDAPGMRRLFRAFSGSVVIFQQGRLSLHLVTY